MQIAVLLAHERRSGIASYAFWCTPPTWLELATSSYSREWPRIQGRRCSNVSVASQGVLGLGCLLTPPKKSQNMLREARMQFAKVIRRPLVGRSVSEHTYQVLRYTTY